MPVRHTTARKQKEGKTDQKIYILCIKLYKEFNKKSAKKKNR